SSSSFATANAAGPAPRARIRRPRMALDLGSLDTLDQIGEFAVQSLAQCHHFGVAAAAQLFDVWPQRVSDFARRGGSHGGGKRVQRAVALLRERSVGVIEVVHGATRCFEQSAVLLIALIEDEVERAQERFV